MLRNMGNLNNTPSISSISSRNYVEQNDISESETSPNTGSNINLTNEEVFYKNKNNENNMDNLKDMDEQNNESIKKKTSRSTKKTIKSKVKSEEDHLKDMLENKINDPLELAKLFGNYDELVYDAEELTRCSENYAEVEKLDDAELENFITDVGPLLIKTLEDLDLDSSLIEFLLDDAMSQIAELDPE